MEINTLMNIFRTEITRTNPELTAFNQGSVLYTLARSMAGTMVEVYNELDRLKNSSYIIGSEVDSNIYKNISPDLSLREGAIASGEVIITNLGSSSVTVIKESVLTHNATTTQYIIQSPTVQVSPLIETKILVRALEPGTLSNLKAGTTLFTPQYPRLKFTVGSFRNSNNVLVGDLKGGRDIESGEDYRKRILDTIFSNRINNQQEIINILKRSYAIQDIRIETVAGGMAKIWITADQTYSTETIEEMKNLIQPLTPIGILVDIRQIQTINLRIRVYAFDKLNNVFQRAVRESIRDYVNNIGSRGELSVINLRNFISESTGIIVKVLEPVDNIVLENNQVFNLLTVEVIDEN